MGEGVGNVGNAVVGARGEECMVEYGFVDPAFTLQVDLMVVSCIAHGWRECVDRWLRQESVGLYLI